MIAVWINGERMVFAGRDAVLISKLIDVLPDIDRTKADVGTVRLNFAGSRVHPEFLKSYKPDDQV